MPPPPMPPPPEPCAKLTLCWLYITVCAHKNMLLKIAWGHNNDMSCCTVHANMFKKCTDVQAMWCVHNCLPLQMSWGHNMSCNVLPPRCSHFPQNNHLACTFICIFIKYIFVLFQIFVPRLLSNVFLSNTDVIDAWYQLRSGRWNAEFMIVKTKTFRPPQSFRSGDWIWID